MTQPAALRASSSESARNSSSETALSDSGVPVSGDIPSSYAPRTGADYLQLARDASGRMFSEVENVICQERIQRYKGKHGESHEIDVVEASVAVTDGEERYSDILQNHKHRSQMQQIGGAWSEGEYATFLREARRVLGSNEFIKEGFLTTLNGVPAVMFPYEMDESASAWDFLVRYHRYMLSFHGELWISQATGELLRSRRIARNLDIATGISEVDWTVDFSSVVINGRAITLPSRALYSVTYLRDESKEWNLTSFNSYRRFSSDSTIKFVEVGQESAIH